MLNYKKTILPALIMLTFFVVLFNLLHWQNLYDNKYTAGPPYSSNGILNLSESDINRPIFLIDDWEFYLDQWYSPSDFATEQAAKPQYIFIGQYSNFSYVKHGHSPFGRATYRMQLKLDGPKRGMALEIPEIFTNYKLWVNGIPITQPKGSSMVDFILDGQAELILNVENRTHYYSGLYYPPALGTPSVINRMLSIRQLFYGVLCISTLTLALFSLTLWLLREKDQLYVHFGLYCFSFFVVCLHPFIRMAGLNGTLWYAIEDGARLTSLMQAARIGSIVSGFNSSRINRFIMQYLLPAICLLCITSILFIIPAYGQIINFYGVCIDTCTLAVWVWLCVCAAKGIQNNLSGSNLILASGCALGIGYLVNLLNNNRFEPIYTGWQNEYTGFLMVLLFSWLIICRNRDILIKNRLLVSHMEELVQERTAELHSVLEERKNFFSDMAHNLKAPIAAVHGFISLIRDGNLYLDDELNEYIHMIEHENNEIGQRVQALNTINAFDYATTPSTPIDLNQLLQKVYEDNYPDTGVMGIYLQVMIPENPVIIYGIPEKILTMFENLIYNAISFTPEGGTITITCSLEHNVSIIKVADTGSGIAPEHLPHIFDRFYVGRDNRSSGTGLGLYIAKITVAEMGGTIEAESVLGEGAVFIIRLPICPNV